MAIQSLKNLLRVNLQRKRLTESQIFSKERQIKPRPKKLKKKERKAAVLLYRVTFSVIACKEGKMGDRSNL